MENESVTDQSTMVPDKQNTTFLTGAFKALRKFTLQFFLPLIAIGPVLMGAEKLAEVMGFHGSNAQFIRIIMMGVYALIIFTVVGSGKKK